MWRTVTPHIRITLFLLAAFAVAAILSGVIVRSLITFRPTGPADPSALLVWLVHPRDNDDSWGVMFQALEHLHGADGAHLYETLFFGLKTKFIYPLTSLLPLELLSQFFTLTLRRLNAVNSAVYLACVGGMLALAMATEPAPGASRGRVLAAVALPTILACWLFYPLMRAVALGQIQLWISCLFIWACACFATNRRLLSGALIGLACTLKPQLGLFLIWALVWRERRFILGFLLTTVPLGVITLLRYGLHNNITYLQVLAFIGRHGEVNFGNQSVNGLVNRWLMNGDSLNWNAHDYPAFNTTVFAASTTAGLLFTLIPLALAFRARRPATPLDLALAALCFTMASPIAWEHHYGVALPAYLLLLRAILAQPPSPTQRPRLCVLAASWTLMANYMPWLNSLAATGANALQSYIFAAALLLLALLMLQTGQLSLGRVSVPSLQRRRHPAAAR